MRPRWKAFGLLTAALVLLFIIMFSYIGAMGYFELDTEEVIENATPQAGSKLVVENNDGDIEVRTWSRNDVEIVGLKKTYFGKEQLDKIEIRIEQSENLKIDVVRDRGSPWVMMDLKVIIPEGMTVEEISSENGDIDVSGISGDFRLSAENGDIKAEEVTGNITIDAENGDIWLKHGYGNFTLENSNGEIWASYVENIISASNQNSWIHIHWTDHIGKISTENGQLWVKNSGTCKHAENSNGEIVVRVRNLTSDGMTIKGEIGKIDITVPVDLKANYNIDVENGDVNFRGFSTSQREGGKDFGHLNGGGPEIDIDLANGEIFLRGE